jgi:hypothetical protein
VSYVFSCVQVKPGSPVTLVRFNIKASDAAMIPSMRSASGPEDLQRAPALADWDTPPLGVSLLQTGPHTCTWSFACVPRCA